MKPPRTYTTAGAFRKALEDRLRVIARTEKVDISRLRRQVVFDRLLARLFRDESAPWALKGGYALEVQVKVARATCFKRQPALISRIGLCTRSAHR